MKKGFTLIELLAVIVVISVLITLTTVSITRTVKNSKNSLYNTQIKSIQSAAEQYGSENLDLMPKADSTNTTIINYFLLSDIQESGILDTNIKNPKTKKAFTDNDLVIKVTATYITKYKTSKLKYEVITDKDEISTIKTKYNYILVLSLKVGDEEYFDVSTGEVCTQDEYEETFDEARQDYLNSMTGYNGLSETSRYPEQNSCLKFYVLKTNSEESDNAVDLILDHNTTGHVAWNSTGETSDEYTKNGPQTAINQLATDTDSWIGTIGPRDYKYTNTTSGITYSINYKTGMFTSRLITIEEVAQLNDMTDFDNKNPNYSVGFDFTKASNYGWLFDRIDDTCNQNGCNNVSIGDETYGYWTVSATASSTYVFSLNGKQVIGNFPFEATTSGIRPVITVSKDKFK